MFHRILGILLAALLWANPAWSFEVQAILRKVDIEKGVLVVFAGGQERTVRVAPQAKLLNEKGEALANGLKNEALKEGAVATLSVERDGNGGPMIQRLQLGGNRPASSDRPSEQALPERTSTGLKPLTEMTADDRYKGEDGGLYGAGANVPPATHQAAAKRETAKIEPLNAAGQTAQDGKIVLVSISMSNATQEFSRFKQIADSDSQKSPRLTIVDCAQGGQAMAQWVNPNGNPWSVAKQRIQAANVTPQQVQVAWVKLANVRPSGELSEHGRKLQMDTLAVVQNAKRAFPNLRVIYLASRIYGGYGRTPLNPEPFAYEGAFAARWLIQDQIKGNPELNYISEQGPVKAPLLLWGPYLWADGITPRKSDGLVWLRSDFSGDGTHPSNEGRQKVADLLLNFFKSDRDAQTWFLTKSP